VDECDHAISLGAKLHLVASIRSRQRGEDKSKTANGGERLRAAAAFIAFEFCKTHAK
jgi:hypothetical protein